MKRNILFLSYLSGMGGGETFIFNHMNSLSKSMFTPFILVGSIGTLNDKCQENGIYNQELPYRKKKGLSEIINGIITIKNVLSFIKQHHIDIIHINDIEVGKYGAISAYIAGIPVIWTCHGWWYAGILRELFYRLFINHTVSVSKSVNNIITQRRILQESNTSVIYPGVDTDLFTPHSKESWFDCQCNKIIVAIIGRFQPIKGHDTYIDAARIILQNNPDFRFVIVGGNVFDKEDDKEHYLQIKLRVESDPLLSKSIQFIEHQYNVTKVLASIDILVSASDAETFGMIHIEAMSSGIPVVSTNIGGPSEIVIDGITGFLIQARNPQELANKIIILGNSLELRNRFGIEGRRRVLSHFSLESQTQTYINTIYNKFPIS